MNNIESDRLTFLELMREGFERAARACGETVESFYAIGGYSIRLVFAGPALQACLTPALAHLSSAPTDSPALTLHLWDSVSTGTQPPLLLASLIELLRLHWFEQLDGRRRIKGYNDARFYSTFHPGPDNLDVLDRATDRGYCWVPDAAKVPYYEQSGPLREILSVWMSAHRRYFLHAAGVGTATGGVVMVGKGGTGKSTTTLACLSAGLGIVGDDYLLLSIDSAPYVYSIYNVAKLVGTADVERFPQLASALLNRERAPDEKAMFGLYNDSRDLVLSGFPVKAVLVPQITGCPETRLEPTTAAFALMALAPSTLFQLPGSTPDTLQALAQLVKQVPCYRLELGTEIEKIPGVIRELLSELVQQHDENPK